MAARKGLARLVRLCCLLAALGYGGWYAYDELFKPGQPLDASKYYVIIPDALGHGVARSHQTASRRNSRSTTMPIWSTRNIDCYPKGSGFSM